MKKRNSEKGVDYITEGRRIVTALYSPRSKGEELNARVVAERAVGHALPRSVIVHHHDENPLNDRNDNLVICENRAYHALIHMRMRVLKAGGDPNLEKICDRCQKPLPLSAFGKNPAKTRGVDQTCLACRREVASGTNAHQGAGKYIRTAAIREKCRRAALRRKRMLKAKEVNKDV
jgi:hypothetical protein